MTATTSDSPQPSLRELLDKFEHHLLHEHPDPDMTKTCQFKQDVHNEILGLLASAKLEELPHEQDEHVKTFNCVHAEGYNQGAAAQYAAIWVALGINS